MNATLPQWCADIISSPPRAGDGFHNWLFRAARALWKCGRDENNICPLLENAAATCGRYVSQREISDAVRNSQASAFRSAGAEYQPWPSFNCEKRKAVVAIGFGLIDLWEISPVHFKDNKSHTEELIDRLFPDNPLLCCGQSKFDFATRSREEWRGRLSTMQLIVPSPMTARLGHTKDGRESPHTLESTGARRFLVVEQDNGTIDEQAAVLLHLVERWPLVIAVHSGGKSLQGWFYCAGQPEGRLRAFMRYAVSLGADSATWCRSQFVRMPDGTRANGTRQTVYFLNPRVVK